MTDHADIDALAANLPAIRPPANDAPILVRLWWAVRTLWSRVHIRRWRTVSDTGVNVYQEHVRTGERRVRTNRVSGYQPIALEWMAGGEFLDPSKIRPPRSPSAVTLAHGRRSVAEFGSCERLPPHGNKDLAAIDAETDRLRALADDLRERQRTQRLTAMVNDAKSTPIPLLDDLAADIQAARFAGSSGSNAASSEVLSMLRRRLLTDLPSVSASEIFADLGIDPDPPSMQGQQSSAMWASVQASRAKSEWWADRSTD